MKMLIAFVMMLGVTIGLFAQDSLNVTRVGFYDTPGYAVALAVAGNYAYVGEFNQFLRLVNITNPANPVEAGSCNTEGNIYGVTVAGNYAYLATNGEFRVVNITNPTSPTLAGHYYSGDFAFGIAVSGNYVYVANNTRGLRVVNVTNPMSPTEVGFYDTPGSAYGVAVEGNYAYVADGGSGLRVINILDPEAPFEIGFYDTPGRAEGVAVVGNYAYVADVDSGLRIVNIANPAAPVEVGFYDTPGCAYDVAVAGNYAYVADDYSGLRVVNISNPSSPFETGFYNTPGRALAVEVSGDYAYVADGESGLEIFDCSVAAAYIDIISPNGGESWRILQFDTIRWASHQITNNVKIELNRHYPNGTWETLADNTANDGQEAIYVTDPLSDSCRIRVSKMMDSRYFDVSNANFSIASSQGYLALAQISQPATPVLSWNAGTHECPETAMIVFHLKNFGSENLLAFMPQLAVGSVFTFQTECPLSFVLSPNEMSACSLRLTYNPQAEGTHRDTLVIQTDAVNGVCGYVRIPLSGSQTRTPASPQVTIATPGSDARLSWFPISESIGGCPISVTHYLVFYSPTFAGPYYYHGYTADTTYVHLGVVHYASGQFYNVTATTAPLPLLARIPRDTPREVVKEMLREEE